jgi:outer membrane protein assembly factor BamA
VNNTCRFIFWGLYLTISTVCASPGDSLKPKKHKLKVLPLPEFGYAPETRWYAGGVALFTYKIFDDSTTRTTNFKLELNYTQNNQTIVSSDYNIFLKNNRFYFFGENSFQRFPENFWGIGNHTSNENLEKYDANRLELNNGFLKQVKKGIYIGPTYRMQYMYNIRPEPRGILDNGTIPGAGTSFSSGLGYTINWDRRDNILNPRKGLLLSFSNSYFGKIFGSSFGFQRFEIDARKYFKLFSKHILAVQAFGIFNKGNPPFRMMALMGSESIMRGYYQGRYRDKNYLTFQAEYRMPVYWIFGLTTFAALGDVASRLENFEIINFKATYGLGLRIRVDKRDNVNLRFDYAMGRNTSGFYVVFGEAF